MTRFPITTLCCLAVFLAAFTVQDDRQETALDRESLADVAPLVEGNTEFAVELFKRLPRDENLFCSPFGVSEALAICHAGARGETATQMATALGFPNEGKDVHEEFNLLHLVQENLERSKSIDYEMASSLWSTTSLRPAFTEITEREYGAELFKMGMDSSSKVAAKAMVEEWIKEKTRGKGTLPDGAMDNPNLVLLVLNTIYMKAPWKSQFDERATKELPFNLLDGTAIDVPTMRRTGRYRYGKWYDLEVLELAYKGDELSMFILLPEAGESLALIESELTRIDLFNAMRCVEPERVGVSLPRFSIKSALGFQYMLEGMGMTDAFNPETADFSGMTSMEIWIEKVLQNARIDVDEAGTEAVAVTAVSMVARGAVQKQPDPIVFRADRPFMFVIRENLTNTVLFMGRVVDPRSSDEK